MSKKPNYRSRVWNLLRTAQGAGKAGVTVATLAAVLGAAPALVLAAMLPDMLESTPGEDPAIYCKPGSEGPTFVPRRFPGGEG